MGFDRDSIAGDNIAVIWIDDLIDVFTWRDAYGVTIQTPNLDRLLGSGVRFSNAYATVPLCAPCRAELTTGLSPFRTGLVDLNRLWRDVLPPTEAWQYDLRRAGFRTFTTGKTDGNYNPMPEEYRRVLFHEDAKAEAFGKRTGHRVYLEKGPGIRSINAPDDDGSQDCKLYDYWVAQNAIDHLAGIDPARRHLIQLGFKHPHYDLVCPDRFYQMYDADAIHWPQVASPEDFTGPQPGMATYENAYIVTGQFTPEKLGTDGWREVVRGYFAACSHMDYELGRFLDALAASPIAGNTTVVLLSDNGFNLGTHDSFHKMSQWDSAAHVPLGLWSPRMQSGQVIDLPISLHNLPKTVLDLAGRPPRAHWTSGQSLLPLIDPSFGSFDETKSPITCVFGTLSVRPSVPGFEHLRYFRYPNGEEHVYDVVADPGETVNLAETAPLALLRDELVRGALDLGLDLSGMADPAVGVNAMMAVDGTVAMAGGSGDNHYWAYGADAESIVEDSDGGHDTLWYMGGPDDFTLNLPKNVEAVRVATVQARYEDDPATQKVLRIVAHPDSPINFETSERVTVEVTGSHGNDEMIGPKYDGATFHGGAGNDRLIARSGRGKSVHRFFGGPGDDFIQGGAGRDILDGGPGDDTIHGGTGHSVIRGGPGNDTIIDDDGASEIFTGPGRNLVTSLGGDDVIHVGTGHNELTGGPGATQYRVAYGGVALITDWNARDRLELVGWPTEPGISKSGDTTEITLGLSRIRLCGAALSAQQLLRVDV
ncbi:sulfatase-like hydrolase/transferase [Oceaniovalibus sp. ACAM 378]|uniref:sulfatase-like hydrolase/transferase n=1 Tax=Oceaniovalibus sp. ACAM 378 TaxID=2599923 RepID=UPI0011D98228|nr:sulfatase-like hydrolase/transferase [Oceaniovalibus sp. ACAM 378]TYB85563.1 sulfatase-like hydrolase/transferase [Oceaniovalibus sp. ACAM 378]